MKAERHPDASRSEVIAARWIAASLALSILAGIGLLVLYALGGQVQLEGSLLAILLGGIGVSLILWGKHLFRQEVVTEEREPHPSAEPQVAAAEQVIEKSEQDIGRRTFLVRLFLAAAGALGLAAIFPIRSLGPSPGRSLFQTAWRAGSRVVDEQGIPVKVTDLEVNGVVTVFPEGANSAMDSQAVLLRVIPEELQLPPGQASWAPEGFVCYSKICTHAGCPVGLFSPAQHQLLCPCHQSAFDVLNGGQPQFGPAARPLPQLPLTIDPDGSIRAQSDFQEPVGPGFWNRGSQP